MYIIYTIKDSSELLTILQDLCDGKHSKFSSIHQLELETGIGASNISKYDTKSPTLKNLLKIFKALDMELCFCDENDLAKLRESNSNIQTRNKADNIGLENLKSFEITSSENLISYIDSLPVARSSIEKNASLPNGTFYRFEKTGRINLTPLIKLANSLGFKLYFLNLNDIYGKNSYLELSQFLIDSEAITSDNLITSNHPIISDLNNFFASDKVSDEQKVKLESKIKDLLYEETKKLL